MKNVLVITTVLVTVATTSMAAEGYKKGPFVPYDEVEFETTMIVTYSQKPEQAAVLRLCQAMANYHQTPVSCHSLTPSGAGGETQVTATVLN